MHIIGIHGPLGSGKTTSAKIISNLLAPYRVRILPFSDPLKRIAIEMGWNGKKDEKGRKLLQLLGTDCGRNLIKPTIWIDRWHNELYERKVDYLITDDIRFKNELAKVHKLIGLTIKIKGRVASVVTDATNHASEKEIEDKYFHYCIDNSGTLEELEFELKEIVNAAVESDFQFSSS